MSAAGNAGPKAGDLVLFCAHVARITANRIHVFSPAHWWESPGQVTTPRGDTFDARWICICEDCHLTHGKKNLEVCIHQHARWIGKPPPIDRIQ
jgi:hypothetical protein